MTLYAESSAVLAWLLDEAAANAAWSSLRRAEIVLASDLTLIESRRVFRRLTAVGALPPGAALEVSARLEGSSEAWTLHRITASIAHRAGAGFPVEPIRTLHAIHLATALALRNIQPDLRVLSLDRRVRENAAALGFGLEPDSAPAPERRSPDRRHPE